MKLFIAVAALFALAAILLLVWPLLRAARGPKPAPRDGIAATLVAAILPVAAFGLYFWASNWTWEQPEQASPENAHDLHQVIAQLQERLARKPDDVHGWLLLGRSATVVGDYPLARKAFGEAYTQTGGRDADAVVGYAEAMVLIDEREIDGRAGELFEQALKMAPDNPRALWYGGIVAYRRGDMSLAQRRWVELQNQELPADLRQLLAERLAELERTRGAPAVAPATAAAAPAAAIEISVGLDSGLVARVPPDSTLFVIARRGSGGPPVAVQRHAVGSWPVSVRLSDSDAMMPGVTLAGGGPLTLIARVSRSGQPVASSGDLFGEVSYDFASAHPASITIDRIVP